MNFNLLNFGLGIVVQDDSYHGAHNSHGNERHNNTFTVLQKASPIPRCWFVGSDDLAVVARSTRRDLVDNVCGGRDFIEINGKRRHAISYLGDFLFSPDRVRTPMKALSGGEQSRAILARLFTERSTSASLSRPNNPMRKLR